MSAWPSASSATIRCVSVSGRTCTALAMLASIRRASAAWASDSCGATGVCSGSIRPLPGCTQSLHFIQDGTRHSFLPRARHVPLHSVRGQDRDLVLVGLESDARARDVVDHDCVQPLALEVAPSPPAGGLPRL